MLWQAWRECARGNKHMSEKAEKFYVFAEDHQTYGPADSILLQEWACNGLISPRSWVYQESSDVWCRAEKVRALHSYLAHHTSLPEASKGPTGLRGAQLRRIRLLADMTDEQAEKFVSLAEKIKLKAFSPIVKQGEYGDSMFLILDGEARVSVRHGDKEDMIATLSMGDFFGEIALFDGGPRSADVVANKDCTLLQISKKNLENIISRDPEVASRFLVAMGGFLGGRVRATNERFSKAQHFARGVAGQVAAPNVIKLKMEE